MFRRIRRFFSELTELGASPSEIYRLTGLTVAFAVFEGVGLGLLLPVASYATGEAGVPPGPLAMLPGWLGFAPGEQRGLVLLLLLGLTLIPFLLRNVLQYAHDIGVAKLKYRIIGRVTKGSLKANLRAEYAYLQAQDVGRLQSYFTVEAERAAEAMSGRMVFFTSFVLLLVYVVLMAIISPLLTLYIVPLLAIIGMIFRFQQSRTSAMSEGVAEENTRFGSEVSESLHGTARIKMRGQEQRTIERVFATLDRVLGLRSSIEKLTIRTQIGLNPVLVIAAFSVVWVGAGPLQMGLERLGVFLLLLTRLGPHLTLINAQWSNIHACMQSFRRLDAQRREAEARCEALNDGEEIGAVLGDIALRDVSLDFGTPSQPIAVLKGLNCDFRRNETTAIVGRSGAGKTTVLRLLSAFYLPTSGQVLFGGVDASRISTASLRRAMALVPQEPFLFSATIRENLCFGIDGPVSSQRLLEALRVAHCLEFVDDLPGGLDYAVGPRGMVLSQGQRQRLAIAHALLTEPEVLLLDEPTSALDTESEQAIKDTLQKLQGRMTIIIIAHRLDTIVHANSVILMESGEVRVQGSHAELLADSTAYRTLFKDGERV